MGLIRGPPQLAEEVRGHGSNRALGRVEMGLTGGRQGDRMPPIKFVLESQPRAAGSIEPPQEPHTREEKAPMLVEKAAAPKPWPLLREEKYPVCSWQERCHKFIQSLPWVVEKVQQTCGQGFQMLLKMGYKGGALGKEGSSRHVNPLDVYSRPRGLALQEDELSIRSCVSPPPPTDMGEREVAEMIAMMAATNDAESGSCWDIDVFIDSFMSAFPDLNWGADIIASCG
ncbi:unnamed protein product [Vitrella brassicaformis CCMP3155]|uniref:G-patch domain-containing protein n=1 Tax=Vitrella brassicaformis (strain CCMP3155) TaxID=1169540 RepID=A0A0G4EDM6_VITBC|nr:unnamed protein product [Vitrella brassicaformis CCMP3155]|eukprot:CEL93489.1 unnamed protein product [Vitrella brassicaformis CCMP3155]